MAVIVVVILYLLFFRNMLIEPYPNINSMLQPIEA